MKSTRIFCLFIIYFFWSYQLLAGVSSNVYEGYIVNNQNDTFYGKIELQSPIINEIKVKFANEQNEWKTYKASELVAYAFKYPFKNDEFKWVKYTKKYVNKPPITFGKQEVMLMQQEMGEHNIYIYYRENDLDLRQPFSREILVEIGHELILLTQGNYKEVLKSITLNCPTLSDKIGSEGYELVRIDRIIEEYQKENCEVKGL